MIFFNPDVKILKEKELYIFDMDGTIHLGNKVFDFAINFLHLHCATAAFVRAPDSRTC